MSTDQRLVQKLCGPYYIFIFGTFTRAYIRTAAAELRTNKTLRGLFKVIVEHGPEHFYIIPLQINPCSTLPVESYLVGNRRQRLQNFVAAAAPLETACMRRLNTRFSSSGYDLRVEIAPGIRYTFFFFRQKYIL